LNVRRELEARKRAYFKANNRGIRAFATVRDMVAGLETRAIANRFMSGQESVPVANENAIRNPHSAAAF
jgi:hypothetical protein